MQHTRWPPRIKARRPRTIRELLTWSAVAVLVAGVVTMFVSGLTTGGLLVGAGTAIGMFAEHPGGLRAPGRYRRRVSRCLSPISAQGLIARGEISTLEREAVDAQRIVPPGDLSDDHARLIGLLRGVADERLHDSDPRSAVVDGAESVQRLMEIDDLLIRLELAADARADRNYASKIRRLARGRMAREREVADLWNAQALAAITKLRRARPPRALNALHYDLIEALSQMQQLRQRREDFVLAHDEQNAVQAGKALEASRHRLRRVVSAIWNG